MSLLPLPLLGSMVTLEPMARSHVAPLAAAGLHPELWRLQPRAISSVEDMQGYVDLALDEQERGTSLPFVVAWRATGAVIGSTRFMDIALSHRRLEVGATWYTPSFQRSGANAEAKLLMLTHAFDVLDVQKVVLKTEALNTQSRTAIRSLGAVEEGTFRKHFISDEGRSRDMVYFSILDSEWPDVRERIQAKISRFQSPV
jgi:RimJ/RimL family protein N-acetyltransferase